MLSKLKVLMAAVGLLAVGSYVPKDAVSIPSDALSSVFRREVIHTGVIVEPEMFEKRIVQRLEEAMSKPEAWHQATAIQIRDRLAELAAGSITDAGVLVFEDGTMINAGYNLAKPVIYGKEVELVATWRGEIKTVPKGH
jgi:hypothetical protein